jgi:hypothetical protein
MADTGSRRRVRAHRDRLRAQGLRPVQIWVPDVNAEGFAAQAHRQSRAVAASEAADDDQASTWGLSCLTLRASGQLMVMLPALVA